MRLIKCATGCAGPGDIFVFPLIRHPFSRQALPPLTSECVEIAASGVLHKSDCLFSTGSVQFDVPVSAIIPFFQVSAHWHENPPGYQVPTGTLPESDYCPTTGRRWQ